jgi:GDP-4-dehydro-6-deoxy-D-mannose reductase
MRVLVTGADGFVGPWLVSELHASGHSTVLAKGPQSATAPLDVSDATGVARVVREASADAIVHLAGQSSVAASHQDPALSFRVNAAGTLNLLQAVRLHSPQARLLLIGSGEVYGTLPPGTQAREESPLEPSSPYASAKVAAEVLGLQFGRSYGLDVVSARPFNHLGRGQSPGFVVPSFAAQLRRIRHGEQEPRLRVGNLEPVRDFSHVKDVVAGYRLLLERAVAGQAYNVCSGQGLTIRAILDALIELAGVQVTVEVDPSRYRPSDAPYLVGSPARLEALGWTRRLSIEDALRDVLQP